MSKFKLLLLDANVVIYLHELGLWDTVVEQCDVHLSATVIGECDFFRDANEIDHRIDLRPYIENGTVTMFEVPLDKIIAFMADFSKSYKADLDPGEAESLTYLLESTDEYTICSADHIVFQVLGSHYRSGQGLSLEELLQVLGKTRKLGYQFTKAFREKCNQSGFADGFQGRSSN